MALGGFLVSEHGGETRIRTDEEVIVNLPAPLAGEILGAKVTGRLELHVAFVAVGLGDIRIIETARSVTGDPGEMVRIVVVLASHEIAVMGDAKRQADLVA